MTTITRKTIQQIKSFRLGPLFKGRLNRKPYAWFIFLFCVMQLVIVIAYPYFLVGMTRVFLGIEPDTLIYSDRVYTTSGLIGIWAWFIGICAWLILSSVLSIVLCIVLAGAMRRRLHDCGYSGKYLLRDLILFTVPVIVSITRIHKTGSRVRSIRLPG